MKKIIIGIILSFTFFSIGYGECSKDLINEIQSEISILQLKYNELNLQEEEVKNTIEDYFKTSQWSEIMDTKQVIKGRINTQNKKLQEATEIYNTCIEKEKTEQYNEQVKGTMEEIKDNTEELKNKAEEIKKAQQQIIDVQAEKERLEEEQKIKDEEAKIEKIQGNTEIAFGLIKGVINSKGEDKKQALYLGLYTQLDELKYNYKGEQQIMILHLLELLKKELGN